LTVDQEVPLKVSNVLGNDKVDYAYSVLHLDVVKVTGKVEIRSVIGTGSTDPGAVIKTASANFDGLKVGIGK
jgi:hypothetical protein